jgi:hypothetical protein
MSPLATYSAAQLSAAPTGQAARFSGYRFLSMLQGKSAAARQDRA